jgi:hypothetical protein
MAFSMVLSMQCTKEVSMKSEKPTSKERTPINNRFTSMIVPAFGIFEQLAVTTGINNFVY